MDMSHKIILEVCVDSVESAVNAEKGGAKRVELCANLAEGGTTPSIGMLKTMKRLVQIPVFVIIRPRGGDFLYSEQELDVMKEDVRSLKAAGADGFVIGALNREGTVDMDICQELIDDIRPLVITFHRAIDMTCDINKALEDIIKLGCERVLTSGGEPTSLEGAPVIRRLVNQARGRIIVMPGGGISEKNLRRIADETGCREIHASARRSRDSEMTYKNSSVTMGATYGRPEFSYKVTDRDLVQRLLQVANGEV